MKVSSWHFAAVVWAHRLLAIAPMLAATPRALGLDVLSLARYYGAVADWILPHLVDRPLGLLRSLDQQDLPFFQKHAKKDVPAALIRVPIPEAEGITEHLAIADENGLLALAALDTIEIHAWGTTRQHLDQPDRLTFDLDPGPDVSWREVVEGARLVEQALLEHGLTSFVMITGSRGVHLTCPLIPQAPWREALELSRELVGNLVERYPSRFVATHAMTERAGRIFIDVLRNERGATSIAPYSTRARPGAPVAAPLTWEELDRVAGPASYDTASMPERLAALARDPWEGFWQVQQRL